MKNPLLSPRPWDVQELPTCNTCHKHKQPDDLVRGECFRCWISRIMDEEELEELLP